METLKAWKALAEAHNLTYWLDQGSLLGAATCRVGKKSVRDTVRRDACGRTLRRDTHRARSDRCSNTR